MKKRTGFISNSSTASFVLLGFDVTDLGIKDPDPNDGLYGGDEGGCPPGVDTVIGKFIFKCSSDDYAESEVIDLEPLMVEVQAIREKYGSTQPIKLWTGVMSC